MQSKLRFITLILMLNLLLHCKMLKEKEVEGQTNTTTTTTTTTTNQETIISSEISKLKKDTTASNYNIGFRTIKNGEKRKTFKIKNSDNSLTLVYKILKNQGDPAPVFDCEIYRNSDNKKIHQGKYRGLRIEWHDNKSLKLIPYVGIVEKEGAIQDSNNQEISKNNTKIIKLNL